ncbi:MAG: VWA domain-containing protein, partial [Prevotellaceae bacterium]|nr:VWA domain-containing protein [Prevotellaceae bacterium]
MKYRYLLSIFIQFFYLYTGDCQVDFVPSSCGLFSPYQVDMGKYLRFDEHIDVAGMDVDIANYKNNSAKHDLQIDLLINIFASGDIVRHPLNLCFVLDRSASMAENHRMEKLKTALKYILSKLTTDDYISIVAYDDLAQVILPSRRYNPAQDSIFKAVIDRIPMGGGTNMSAGMFKGYEELNKHYNPLYKNRMILMSDGVPNTGEQDPQRIIQYSTVQYNKGIETSTIGLGNNINFELLYNISVEGRGTSYFVGDCDSAYIDIGAVLKEEL